MRDKVGVYSDAGFPNYPPPNASGYPERVDVSRRLAMFYGNFPDYYETFRPKLDGPFVPSVRNDKDYVANQRYKDVPGRDAARRQSAAERRHRNAYDGRRRADGDGTRIRGLPRLHGERRGVPGDGERARPRPALAGRDGVPDAGGRSGDVDA